MERRGGRGGPGRGQGRKPGSKNRTTLERENTALAEKLRTRQVSKTDLQVMLEIRDFFMGVAAKIQGDALKAGLTPDYDKISQALELAGTMAAKRAPFLHARLSHVKMTDVPIDLSRLSEDELAIFERLAEKASITGGDQGREGATLQ